MEHQRKSAVEEDWQYTPTFEEQCQQTIAEMNSRIRSLENAVEQLQCAVFRDSDRAAAPLGVNLDEISPPPWLEKMKEASDHAGVPGAKSFLKSKLLLPTEATGPFRLPGVAKTRI